MSGVPICRSLNAAPQLRLKYLENVVRLPLAENLANRILYLYRYRPMASTARRVAAITGGGTGVGAAIARQLASSLFDVVIFYNSSREPAESIVESVTASGARALALQMNVTDDASVKAGIAATLSHFGRLDLLVNNAGITQLIPFSDLEGVRESGFNAEHCSQHTMPHSLRQPTLSGNQSWILMSLVHFAHPALRHLLSLPREVAALSIYLASARATRRVRVCPTLAPRQRSMLSRLGSHERLPLQVRAEGVDSMLLWESISGCPVLPPLTGTRVVGVAPGFIDGTPLLAGLLGRGYEGEGEDVGNE